ncbi:hypothetical protein SCHPADRAFT_996286 [Schizopora paradoxa]|uniref:Fungal-type protein kinase domain-containing protein n=1 Tax=Schizopora paradoxa TaxID=27342 RepID=A0A0H2RZM4_9AGAM|nr:hypothetical protein SCHPADRAFT_996286 [Schizopora paradoxa]
MSAHTVMTSCNVVTQDLQKTSPGVLIKGHTHIARMLSPKVLRNEYRGLLTDCGSFRHLLRYLDTLIDRPTVIEIMDQHFLDPPKPSAFVTDERVNYPGVATFVNSCIAMCSNAYLQMFTQLHSEVIKMLPENSRCLKNYLFYVYNKAAGDSYKNTSKLKADLVALMALGPGEQDLAFWTLLDEALGKQIETICEEKFNWLDLVPQCATHARAMFTRCPLRVYRLIPRGRNPVVKCSWSTHHRNVIEARAFSACRGDFGAPVLFASYEPFTNNHLCTTNVYLLPDPGVISEACFRVITSRNDFAKHAEELHSRNFSVSLLRDEGKTLEFCESAWDLCECVLHAMLGYIASLNSGFMQQDVSIGNYLKLKFPVIMKPFTTNKQTELLDAFMNPQHISNRIEVRDKVEELRAYEETVGEDEVARFLQEVIHEATILQKNVSEKFKHSQVCKIIISDGDLATYVPAHFSTAHSKVDLSGTYEFMSMKLANAADQGRSYLRTPLDDMFSFYYVTLWATISNPSFGERTVQEKTWTKQFISGARENVVQDFRHLSSDTRLSTYSPLVQAMHLVLRDWRKELDSIEDDMYDGRQQGVPSSSLVAFDLYAYRAVNAFLNVLVKHLDKISEDLI